MSYKISYRPEIDGLRAIAIMSVLLFHLGIEFISGGYVGVDVFFVISGYLITKIIASEIYQTGNFSFSNFYIRRARRLFPSLYTVFFLATVFSYLLLPPDLLQRFGGSLIHAIYSISNFYFWQGSGYFDVTSEFKPLLHTWSLSVEEQFYLFWPALLTVLLLGSKKIYFLAFLLTLAVLSLHLNTVFYDGNISYIKTHFPKLNGWFLEGQATIFYLLPFRVFEFVIGGILVWVSLDKFSRTVHEILAFIGLLMIFSSFLFYDDQLIFPSYFALLPTVGTALIIASKNSLIVYSVLNNRVMVPIGLVSYTLYLVHWPAIVFYKYWKITPLTIQDYFYILILTVSLTVLIYFLIEKPLRKPSKHLKSNRNFSFGVLIVSAASILLLVNIYIYTGNLEGSTRVTIDEKAINIKSAKGLDLNRCTLTKNMKNKKNRSGDWICNDQAKHQILSLGNSHERHGYDLLRNMFRVNEVADNVNVVFGSAQLQGDFKNGNNPRCYLNKPGKKLPFESENADCNWLTNYLNNYEAVAKKYDVIFIAAFKPLNYIGEIYVDYAAKLQSINPKLKVIILGSFVELESNCYDLINRSGDIFSCQTQNKVKYFDSNEKISIELKWPNLKFHYIDQRGLLCGENEFSKCDIYLNNAPIIYDRHHFNRLAIHKLISKLKETGEDQKIIDYVLEK